MKPITATEIEEASLKGMLRKSWERYRARRRKNPEVLRNPDTVYGFMNKELVHEVLTARDPEKFITNSGLVIVFNDDIAFFTDDGTFAYDFMLPSTSRMTIRNLTADYGPDQYYPDVESIIKRHVHGRRILDTLEELAQYLNDTRQHPEDKGWYH